MTERGTADPGELLPAPSGADDDDYDFDAFISYSRKDADFASRLERALEAYRPPSGLGLPQRRLRVFRDVDDLVGGEYGASINQALAVSRTLIVICSPDARASSWVNDEIRRFAEARGPANIVPILLRGRPNNEAPDAPDAAFPDALGEFLEIPLATSFQSFNGRQDVRKGTLQGSWYTLLATLFGTTRERIEERDQKRKRNRSRMVGGVVASVMASLLALAGWALGERVNALAQARAAEARNLTALAALALDRDGNPTLGFKFAAASLELDPDDGTARTLLLRSLYEGRLFRYRGHAFARPFSSDTFPSAMPEPDWTSGSRWQSDYWEGDPSVEFEGVWAPSGGLKGGQERDRMAFVVRTASDDELGVIQGAWPAADFSPGGSYLALASLDGGAAVYEVEVGDGTNGFVQPTPWLSLPSASGDRVTFSDDGATLLVGNGYTQVRAWHLEGQPLPTLPFDVPLEGPVFVDPLGSAVIAAGTDVVFWRASEGMRRIPAILSAVADDGGRVGLLDDDGVRVLDAQGEEVHRVVPDDTPVSMAYLRDSHDFVTLSAQGLTRWSSDGRVVERHPMELPGAHLVGAEGRWALVANPDSLVVVSWGTGAQRGHAGRLGPGGLSADGNTAVLMAAPDTVRVLDLPSGDIVATQSLWDVIVRSSESGEGDGRGGAEVTLARVSDDGSLVYAGGLDETGVLWEVATGRVAFPSFPPYLTALDFVDSQGFVAAWDNGGDITLTDATGSPAFMIRGGGSHGRWLGGGRFLALVERWGEGGTTILLPFDTEVLTAAAKARGDTVTIADRRSGVVAEIVSPRLPFGGPSLWSAMTACQTAGSLGRCLIDAVGLAALEAAAGTPVFLSGPHTAAGMDLSASDFGRYNPAFVRWAGETLVPGRDDPALNKAMGALWRWGLKDEAEVHYVALQALRRRPELQERVAAEYPGRPEAGAYLISALDSLREDVEGRFSIDAHEVPRAAGFWIRREADGTAEDFARALRTLLTVYDPVLVKEADADSYLWAEDGDFSWERREALVDIWSPVTHAAACSREEAMDWVGGVTTLYCTLRRIGFIGALLSVAPMPVFRSGPHGEGELNLRADTFGHYNPDFVRWAGAYLIPEQDQPAARRVAGTAYYPWRRIGRAYYLALRFLERNPGLDSGLMAAVEGGEDVGRRLWEAMDPIYGEANRVGGGHMPELVSVAGGFWIRRGVDGTRPAFKEELTRLLAALDADFLAEMGR